MIRVMIVANHAEVIEGLSTVLQLAGAIELTGAAAGPEDAVLLAQSARPDLALVDLEMTVDGGAAGAGCAAIRGLAQAGICVIALTAHDYPAARMEALCAGANRVMLKGMDVQAMVAAIEELALG